MATTEADLFRAYKLDSLALNATCAALDERANRLVNELAHLAHQPQSQGRDFAIECNRDAIRDTERARLAFARQIPDRAWSPEDDVTFAKWEAER
jgi:hypothetical protein